MREMEDRSKKRDELIKVFNLKENINIENELKKDFQARTLKGSSKKALFYFWENCGEN